jgi:hypothetical protein
MKIIKNISLSASVLMLTIFSTNIYSQKNTTPINKTTTTTQTATTKYGALAIDRSNGFFYGWAANCSTLSEAEKRATEECSKRGGRCTVVLSYSGTGCAAYRFITGNVGIGFRWGLAKTKEEADAIAKKECSERSYGLPAPNFVWSCNDANSGNLKVIYNADKEMFHAPGVVTPY